MPNIEQKTIMRRIDKRMNRQYDFNRTKARSNMTTRLGSDVDDLLANFLRQYGKLLISEELQLVWGIDGVKYAGHTAPPPIRPKTKYPNPTRLEPPRIRLP